MGVIRCNNEARDDDDGANDGSHNISCWYFLDTVFAQNCIAKKKDKASMDKDNIATTVKSEKKEEDT